MKIEDWSRNERNTLTGNIRTEFTIVTCESIGDSQDFLDYIAAYNKDHADKLVMADKNISRMEAEGTQPETFPQKGLKVNTFVEFDPEVFVPGAAIHVKMHGNAFTHESLKHLGDGVNGIIRGVQDGRLMCVAIWHPQTGEVYDIMVAASDYASGKTEITFLEKPDAKEDNDV